MRTFAFYLAFAVLTFGQSRASRISMQDAYRNWRLVDPNLEADAANPGGSNATSPNTTSMTARAERVAAEAAKYFAERKVYYDALAAEMRTASKNMEPAAMEPASGLASVATPPSSSDGLNPQVQLSAIAANLSAIPKNPDAGLLELRRALERERAALLALKDLPATPSAPAPTSHAHAREDYADLLAEVAQESAESDNLGKAWASYYRALAAGAPATNVSGVRSPVVRPRAVETSGEPQDGAAVKPNLAPTPTRERLAAVIAGKSPGANSSAPAPVSIPAASAATASAADHSSDHADDHGNGPTRSTSAANAPVNRYAGAWVYPTIGEHYHGAHPEAVDLDIRAENGHVKGTFRTKFRIPPGVALDPIVEFTFEGDYQSARSQTFPFVSSDGAKGTLELIPATTFNLLEISFVTEVPPGEGNPPAKSNKITRGNFFLIRK